MNFELLARLEQDRLEELRAEARHAASMPARRLLRFPREILASLLRSESGRVTLDCCQVA